MRQKKQQVRGWATTDEDEREFRRERARRESMRVKAEGGSPEDPFRNYVVSHAEGKHTVSYRVEIRSLVEAVNTCSCPDFAKNGLGTCKHIERALQTARRVAKKGDQASPRGEIFMRRDPWEVVFRAGKGLKPALAGRVGRLFSSEGVLLDGSSTGLSALLAAVERINCGNPGAVRISSEVVAHAALEKARRGLRMGEVLLAGGFAEEAEEACRRAVALAANAPRFLMASVNENTPEEVPDHVDAMTTDELFRAQDELDLFPDVALTLQMSVQGLPLPDCVTRASRFLEECALMM